MTKINSLIRYLRCLRLFHQVYMMQYTTADRHYVGFLTRHDVPCMAVAVSLDRKAWELADFIKENLECKTTHVS